ncbi:MAG: hypothetical protein PVSMB4_16410 [Ktedonobacterales bacterium]
MSRRRQSTAAGFPPEEVTSDGHDALKVASRFGVLWLQRRVLCVRGQHVLPGNAVVPAHQGMVLTRGLQEVACLWPQDLSFAGATRLLGWQAHEEDVLSETTVRSLVRHHGQVLAQAEAAEVATLAARADLAEQAVALVPAHTPRRRPGWPPELAAAVEQAWQTGEATAPAGVRQADWERVLSARRREAGLDSAQARLLGPLVGPHEVLVSTDEVLTRRPSARQFHELRTARLATAQGDRYLCGTGESFLALLAVATLLARGHTRAVLLLGDGARWIRAFFATVLAPLPQTMMILDWFHLHRKVGEMSSRLCRAKRERLVFRRTLTRLLWTGQTAAALGYLEEWRPQAKSLTHLEEFRLYLQTRQAFIPDYRQRRRLRQYIGSGQAEKTNDLLVARRQKGEGMHWSLATSSALMRLQTLRLNQEWDAYWQHRQLPSLLRAS